MDMLHIHSATDRKEKIPLEMDLRAFLAQSKMLVNKLCHSAIYCTDAHFKVTRNYSCNKEKHSRKERKAGGDDTFLPRPSINQKKNNSCKIPCNSSQFNNRDKLIFVTKTNLTQQPYV